MDAAAGWVASTVDLTRFVNSISPATIAAITAKPPVGFGPRYWYGLGVWVVPADTGGVYFWHNGDLEGTASYFVRTSDGTVWAAFFNGLPKELEQKMFADLDAGMWNANGAVKAWPQNDLFANYSSNGTAPAINAREGVVNGATFARGIVSGSWATIFGADLAGTTRTWKASEIVNGRLPVSLDGVSVKINGQPAPVYYISPTQLDVQVPGGIDPSWVTVEVTRDGVTSDPVLTHAVSCAPGILAVPRTAVPGEIIVLYATGLAPTAAGEANPGKWVAGNTQVTIGGRPAQVVYSGLISAGLFQIKAVVPSLDAGPQEVRIAMNGVESPKGVSIRIER